MPEPPDFDQLAHSIAMSVPSVTGAPFILHRTHIAEQLRLIWNARGAADLVKLEAELSSQMGVTAAGPYVQNLDRALRTLDR